MPGIIIGIPGKWPTRTDLARAIVEFSNGYVYAAGVLSKPADDRHWHAELYDHDPNLRRAFQIAGQGLIDDANLDPIASHTHTLYVLGDDVGLAPARAMLDVGRALLDAGGLAVKVESSGTAHDAKTWRALAKSPTPSDLHKALVVLVGSVDRRPFYSCGMHHFALPDTTMPADTDADEAAVAMSRFNIYQMTERPSLKTGHTFSIGPDAPHYRLEHHPCTQFPPDDPFHNPDGYWHLTPS